MLRQQMPLDLFRRRELLFAKDALILYRVDNLDLPGPASYSLLFSYYYYMVYTFIKHYEKYVNRQSIDRPD